VGRQRNNEDTIKPYPSIPGSSQAPKKPCIAFRKYDGSNLRFEWSPKQGWHKFGTRKRLFDETDDVFGPSIPVFHNTLAEPLLKIVKDNKKWRNARRITAYAEYVGPHSFAGLHDIEPVNPMELVLFDVNIHQQGFVSPRDFVNNFSGEVRSAEVVYEGNLNADFISSVKLGEYNAGDGIEEGVVCKGGSGHSLWMAKIKTDAYIAKLKEVFGVGWEQYAE